jgi:hypothetical protein
VVRPPRVACRVHCPLMHNHRYYRHQLNNQPTNHQPLTTSNHLPTTTARTEQAPCNFCGEKTDTTQIENCSLGKGIIMMIVAVVVLFIAGIIGFAVHRRGSAPERCGFCRSLINIARLFPSHIHATCYHDLRMCLKRFLLRTHHRLLLSLAHMHYHDHLLLLLVVLLYQVS